MTMTTATISPERQAIADDQIARAKAVDLLELASTYTTLHRNSRSDWAGPCPRCTASTDGFHVYQKGGAWRWQCFTCHERYDDVIGFIRWLNNCDFRRAVEILTGDELPRGTRPAVPAPKAQQPSDYDWQSASWQRDAQAALTAAQAALFDDLAGRAGRAYLEGRGLHSGAWVAYGLGYSHAVSVPGTEGKEKAAAIAIPWIVGDALRGIRYRFLEKQGPHKQSAFYGSRFGRVLYGGQLVERNRFEGRSLVLCEGEINAASVWQVAADTRLDVLSLGSESQVISDAMLTAIRRYRTVLLWLDSASHARGKLEQLPSATAFQSPGGKDANDLLQAGTLGGVLSAFRLKAAQTTEQRRALLEDLCAGFNMWQGVDDGTRAIMSDLDRSVPL